MKPAAALECGSAGFVISIASRAARGPSGRVVVHPETFSAVVARISLVGTSTAGKGPGIVMRAQNRSGAVRVSLVKGRDKAVLEVLDSNGHVVEVGLGLEELNTLAKVLKKVSLALAAETLSDDTTRSS